MQCTLRFIKTVSAKHFISKQ